MTEQLLAHRAIKRTQTRPGLATHSDIEVATGSAHQTLENGQRRLARPRFVRADHALGHACPPTQLDLRQPCAAACFTDQRAGRSGSHTASYSGSSMTV